MQDSAIVSISSTVSPTNRIIEETDEISRVKRIKSENYEDDINRVKHSSEDNSCDEEIEESTECHSADA